MSFDFCFDSHNYSFVSVVEWGCVVANFIVLLHSEAELFVFEQLPKKTFGGMIVCIVFRLRSIASVVSLFALLKRYVNNCSFAAANPIALGLFEGVWPIQFVQPFQQTFGIGRNAQAPLAHFLLLHGVATTNGEAFAYLIVGQHCA